MRGVGRGMDRLPRPAQAGGPVVGTVLALGSWAAVAHNSGSGWVQALGALLAGFLLVGLSTPALAVRRVRVEVVEAPSDATAGGPVAVLVRTSGAVEVRPLVPGGEGVVVGRRSPRTVAVVPPRHCELRELKVRVASAAPFGLLWWHRDLVLPLPRPVLVAPRLGAPDHAVLAEIRRSEAASGRVPARVGEPRGVREYRPGDLRHWVHWPATAHSGIMMVREMEGPVARPATVRARLPGDVEAAERALEQVFGTVGHLLARGRQVLLVTTEPEGERTDQVRGVQDAGRRLARAVAA
ncbi:MAG TPA: DUF58 domain-containing protein [Acidimicrobiales bacterium]|nr:DUF58 domain-containing protein [Acidimicrobiales bacterium]